MVQSKGFRNAAPLYCGGDFSNSAHTNPIPAMTTARITVDDRHVNDIATSIGRITCAVPSPTPPPTAANNPNVNPRSFGLNHCEIAPVMHTYAPAAAIPFRIRQRLSCVGLVLVENPQSVSAVAKTPIVTAFRLPQRSELAPHGNCDSA